MISDIPEFCLQEKYISSDVRPGREEEKWLNAVVVKRVKKASVINEETVQIAEY